MPRSLSLAWMSARSASRRACAFWRGVVLALLASGGPALAQLQLVHEPMPQARTIDLGRPVAAAVLAPAPDPDWPRELMIITDSVVLGAVPVIQKGLAEWRIAVVGRSAFMLPMAIEEIRRRSSTPPIAVIAVGHNTVWDKNRKNFAFWSRKFDREAETLMGELRARGTRRLVWVQLRELTIDLIPGRRQDELERSWYFPYVNERLRLLVARHPDLMLADWTTLGRQPGVTYDSIHLNGRGSQLMLELIKSAIGL